MSLPSQKELQEQLEKLSETLRSATSKGAKLKPSLKKEGKECGSNEEVTATKSFIQAEIQILQLQLAKIEEEIQRKTTE